MQLEKFLSIDNAEDYFNIFSYDSFNASCLYVWIKIDLYNFS
jgi:hypothetical protein